jgi:hypothetical protein
MPMFTPLRAEILEKRQKRGVLSWKNGKNAHFCLGKVAEIV